MEEKISLWKASYLAAEQQLLQTASFKLSISDIPTIPLKRGSDISFRQLCCGLTGELLDYSEASPFAEIVQVIANLQSIAKEIKAIFFSFKFHYLIFS